MIPPLQLVGMGDRLQNDRESDRLDRPSGKQSVVSTDVLSEVLRAVRLAGATFFSIEGPAPWVAEAPASKRIAQLVLPGCEHVIEYHLLAEGECYAGLIDGPPVKMHAGDIVV